MNSIEDADQWQALLTSLNLKTVHSNPNLVHCPFCERGIMRFLADTLVGGKRFFTTCCHKSGDLLELHATCSQGQDENPMAWLNRYSPNLHRIYVRQRTELARLEPRRQLLESFWQAGLEPSQAWASAQFSGILENRGLSFTGHLSWYSDGIDQQFRYMGFAVLRQFARAGELGRISQRLQAEASQQPVGYLCARLFTAPGQLSGLFFVGLGENNKHLEFVETLDAPNQQDAGLLIHPRHLFTDQPLVVTDDPGWVVNAAFFHCRRTSAQNPVTAFVNLPEHQTQSFQLLVGRPVLLWAPVLTPEVLRLAARLEANVTHEGAVKGKMRNEVFGRQDMHRIFETLSRRAKPWPEALRQHQKSASLQQTAALLQAAGLKPRALDKLIAGEPPEVQTALKSLLSACPQESIATSAGTIQQRPDGWYLLKRGQEILICSHPWRIRSIIHPDQADPECEIQILEQGRWHTSRVAYRQLLKNPYHGLLEASIEHNLGALTIEPKWSSRLVHLARQFYPHTQVLVAERLGVDSVADCVRTSRVQIAIADGHMQPAQYTANRTLLSQGGVELPSPEALQAVLESLSTTQVLSALVQQLAQQFALQQSVVVISPDNYAQQVRDSGEDCKWEQLSSLLSDDEHMKDETGARRKVVIFTEHRDTLNYLTRRIRRLLGSEESVVVISGGMLREERRKAQELFTHDEDTKVLIATDAAGERWRESVSGS